MIEIPSQSHVIRLFADRLSWRDLFRVILYCGYRGDKEKIPAYYTVTKGHSCVTNLRQPLEQLMALMKSNTRNEIRRAIKEGCEFEEMTDVNAFVAFYNAFCASKGLTDFTSLSRIAKYPRVLMTKVVKDGVVLAMHANVLDEKSKTALLLYSCSQRLDETADKKLIGWGNRFLHYKDMEWLKNHGYETYDWSGVCMDPNDARYPIGQFKLAFGGTLIESWTLRTPLFRLLEYIRDWVMRMRMRQVEE